jgi:hypothetical protein
MESDLSASLRSRGKTASLINHLTQFSHKQNHWLQNQFVPMLHGFADHEETRNAFQQNHDRLR